MACCDNKYTTYIQSSLLNRIGMPILTHMFCEYLNSLVPGIFQQKKNSGKKFPS